MTSSISDLINLATVETTKTERTSDGKMECIQLSKKVIGKSPSFNPSQYCRIGPSTNVGADTPTTASTTAKVSHIVLCRRAAMIPNTSPNTKPKMTACTPTNMETGSPCRIICVTGLLSK